MTRMQQLVAAVAIIAACGVRLGAGSAMAHGSLEHPSGVTGLLGHGEGLGLVAVALLTAAGYWLTNRRSGSPPVAGSIPLISGEAGDGSDAAARRPDEAPSANLVAVRRLSPPRPSPPRNPPRLAP